MDKIKILRIISRLNIGGPSIHTILLSAVLKEKGYETILIAGSEGPNEGNMLDLAEEKGIMPIVIPEMGRELSSMDDIRAFLKIFRLIKKEMPDIVHTHTAKAGTLGRLAALFYNKLISLSFNIRRLFRQPHGYNRPKPIVVIHTFHGHVLKGYFGGLKTQVFLLIERFLGHFTDVIITLSEGLKRELVQMKIAPSEKITVITLGLELNRFINSFILKGKFKKSINISENCLLVGIVGRLVPIKGHKVFLRAIKKIVNSFNSNSDLRQIKFVVIGDGELRAELEDYNYRLGISDYVIFTGFRNDLPEIYADMDIVVLSSFNEGTPVSLIEAMASGKTVVATSVGGVPDLVSDGLTGMLIPSGDADALADAITKLLASPALRQKMGQEAKISVYPKYDICNLVRNLDNLYGKTLEIQRAG